MRPAGGRHRPSYRTGAQTAARLWYKDRSSPVTEADIAVDTFLKGPPRPATRSRMAVGGDGRRSARLDRSLVWIVDPIDGTQTFSTGHPDWSVSIALVRDGRPVLGVIYAPIHDHLYEAKLGGGAWRNSERLQGVRD